MLPCLQKDLSNSPVNSRISHYHWVKTFAVSETDFFIFDENSTGSNVLEFCKKKEVLSDVMWVTDYWNPDKPLFNKLMYSMNWCLQFQCWLCVDFDILCLAYFHLQKEKCARFKCKAIRMLLLYAGLFWISTKSHYFELSVREFWQWQIPPFCLPG